MRGFAPTTKSGVQLGRATTVADADRYATKGTNQWLPIEPRPILAPHRRMAMQHANWIAQARAHWKEFLPETYQRLQREGKLNEALREAADETAREMRNLTLQGRTWDEAWEMTRNEYLFPAPEESEMDEPMEPSPGYLLQRELIKIQNELNQLPPTED